MTIGLIVAVSPEGVIGVNNTIPWRHPGDQRRFKRVTLGTTVIMGRNTWTSLGGRPLPGRRNLVLSRSAERVSPLPEGVVWRTSIANALADCPGDAWFIGGSAVYAEAMPYCDILDVTYVPDSIDPRGATLFPPIDENMFEAGPLLVHEDNSALQRRLYTRRTRS